MVHGGRNLLLNRGTEHWDQRVHKSWQLYYFFY